MTLGGWALANPAGLAFALLALPIVALHVLRPRRVQARVDAVFLWRRVSAPVSAARPWQRLTPSWLLAAQVLAALLLGLLMARPVRLTDTTMGEHTVFVIDASASMQSTDGTPDRFAAAKERIAALRDQVPAGGVASLVVAGDGARAPITRSADRDAFDEALARATVGDGGSDFAGAFALAAGLDTPDLDSQTVFVSDGGVDPADLRTAPPDTLYEAVGDGDTNRAVTRLSVEPGEGGQVARVTVANLGGPAAEVPVRIDVDGITAAAEIVAVEPGGVANLAVPVPLGDRVEAFLEADDLLALDNRAVATVSRRPRIDVVWAGADDPFLAAALGAIGGVEVDRVEAVPAELDPAVDLVVAVGVPVPPGVGVGVLAVDPPADVGGVRVVGTVTAPVVTLLRAENPLLAGLDLSGVRVAESRRLEAPATATVLLGAEGAPLVVTADDPVPTVVVAFALDQSTLGLQAAFPLMVERMVTELSGSTVPPARLDVGDALPVDGRREAVITDPGLTSRTVPPGAFRPVADRVGFWTVDQPDLGVVTVAVAADRAESSVAPAVELPFAEAFAGTTPTPRRGQRPMVGPVVVGLLALLAAEYALARRRRGVGARQWQVAGGLRLAVAGSLLTALIAPTLSFRADEVATIFLIDTSDSMTARARAEAVAVVGDALAVKPPNSPAAVVVFGADARLETLLATDPVFAGVTVETDPSGTDLSAALRLAAAALPGDARPRLVLLSDGRATSGDTGAEAARLAEAGVPVDVVVVGGAEATDTAVAGVDAPSTAAVGDRIDLDVRVAATERGPAEVVVRTDAGREVGRRTVDLVAGTNTVRFSDVVGEEGLVRYQATIGRSGDPVPANDVGFAAVPVSGSERVLLVEGDEGEGAGLANALRAAGLTVDVVGTGSLPALDELSGYAATVMVDVDRFDLADAQVADLVAATRDVGRGLVVVGGTSSYALGGYRGSDLEEILPVESEITDPLRRQTVAEVLAVDTSGSMAACHCDENGQNGLGGGNRLSGGVKKTTIAATAVTRAIAALDATDEVGLLSMDADDQWLINLQPRPDRDTVDDAVSRLVPDGPTFLDTGLATAAEQLRSSDANLKHVILFSDGFTEPRHLAAMEEEAARLYEEGITVSVVATGEGAAEGLEPVAEAGGGRFYPGRNLDEVPDLIVQEAVLASRAFVTEGEFLPTVTSDRAPVAGLVSSPPLNGYIATTARPTATVDLRIGPEEDPLLASWSAGLGRVTAWTSDAGNRWAAPWAAWDGSPAFWAGVVKDTFPTGSEGGGVTARIVDGRLEVTVEGDDAWGDDAVAAVTVAGPDGTHSSVPLERVDGTVFAGSVPVDATGTYAVGATVQQGGDPAWTGTALANQSFPAEYAPRPVERDELVGLADRTGGRVDPEAAAMFDPEGTVAGTRRVGLAPWLFLFAALAWPVAVAVSRLRWRRGVLAQGAGRATSTVAELRSRLPRMTDPGRTTVPTRARAQSPGPERPGTQSPERPGTQSPDRPGTQSPDRPGSPGSAGDPPDGGGPSEGSTVSALLRGKRSRGR
ncbi:MAG: VWA domain-containing protein [Acidimicrobiales bacterium]